MLIKNKKIIVLVMAVAMLNILGCSKGMDAKTTDFIEQVNVERSMEFIAYLSDTIGSRPIGTHNEYEAACYIEEEFKKLGMETEITQFPCRRVFDNDYSWNVEAIRKPSGEDKADTNEIVYVTAHFDSVDAGPGANDNASGVAAIIEIATAMKDLDIDREIRFVAFGGEEAGLLGSKAYVEALSEEEKARSIGCFNLDMVATEYEEVTELGIYTPDGEESIITKSASKVGKELSKLSTKSTSYEGEAERDQDKELIMVWASDHTSFDEVGIPAAVFINIDPSKKESLYDCLEPYYHTDQDHIDNISSERLERSIKLAGGAIYNTIEIEH